MATLRDSGEGAHSQGAAETLLRGAALDDGQVIASQGPGPTYAFGAETVAALQTALTARVLYDGPHDGDWRPAVVRAMRRHRLAGGDP